MFFLGFTTLAQNVRYNTLDFETISAKEGLSQVSVNDITRDSYGFIWAATQDGLNRYDGYNFRVYKRNPRDNSSLSFNYVQCIFEDIEKNLWVGTLMGLNKYNPKTETFKQYVYDFKNNNSPASNDVSAITQTESKDLWIATNGGWLNRLSPSIEKFTRFKIASLIGKPSVLSVSINSLTPLPGNILLIGTSNGLYLFDVTSLSIQEIPIIEGNNQVFVSSVDKSNSDKNLYFIGTQSVGLYQFDIISKKITSLSTNYIADLPVSSVQITGVVELPSGELCIGTQQHGLVIESKETISRNFFDESNPYSIGANNISNLLYDDSGILWIGTEGGGIAKFDILRKPFYSIRRNALNPNSLSHSFVYSIYKNENKSDELWIGTGDGGLNILNLRTGINKIYRHNPSDAGSIGSDYIIDIFRSSTGRMWIATVGGGLNLFNETTGRFSRYLYKQDDKSATSSNRVRHIYEDSDLSLWVATDDGLYILSPEGVEIKRISTDDGLSSNKLRYIYKDRFGLYWIGSIDAGVTLYNPQKNSFFIYRNKHDDSTSLSSDAVTTIFEDSSNNLWITTGGGGINKFNREKGNFSFITTANGLPNDVCYAMVEDTPGTFWISTNYGLSRYDSKQETFKNYTEAHGLQSNEFNRGGFFKGSDGTLYFGGTNGLTYFKSSEILPNLNSYNVVLTDFLISSKSILDLPQGSSPLKQSLLHTNSIKLNYDQGVFSISFAALSFRNPELNKYAYILEGFDSRWNEVGSRTIAYYTNVPPGEYVFKVKATNGDGMWNEEPRTLTIIITPPFFLSNFAKILYITLLVLLLYMVYRRFDNRNKKEMERTREELNAQKKYAEELFKTQSDLINARLKAEEMNKLKTSFLANMSHELRTPMNGILGLATMIQDELEDTDPNKDYVRRIYDSGQRLMDTLNLILDLSVLESSKLRPAKTEVDLVAILNRLESKYSGKTEDKGIMFSFESSYSGFITLSDARLFMGVIDNLLSNALKFTREGFIVLSFSTEERNGKNYAVTYVADSGIGIPDDKKDVIFEEFRQVSEGLSRSHEGNGLGLTIAKKFVEVLGGELTFRSSLGKGSTFFVYLPIESAPIMDTTAIVVEHEPDSVTEPKPSDTLPHVLAVEDDSSNTIIVKLFLKKYAIVDTVLTAKDAIEYCKNNRYDIILMDINLGGELSGLDAVKEIRKQANYSRTPIVALSAYAMVGDREKFLENGCTHYLAKPYKKQELQLLIKNIIHEREVEDL